MGEPRRGNHGRDTLDHSVKKAEITLEHRTSIGDQSWNGHALFRIESKVQQER